MQTETMSKSAALERESSIGLLPNFVGIGANRAGSTWIARNLMDHPQVFLPLKKELHFFDQHYENGLTYYEQEFAGWSGEKALGEITPQYFHDESVAPLIKRHIPQAKLFVSLRNPIDRAYSQYWRMIGRGAYGQEVTFEEAIRTRPFMLQYGCYFSLLSRYYEFFDREQVLVLIFDELKSSPQTFMGRIYRFLDVDDTFQSELLDQKINASGSLRHLSHSSLMWYFYRGLIRLKLYKLAGNLEKRNRRTHPQMRSDTRQKLLDYYRQEILQLQDLIDLDLQAWLN